MKLELSSPTERNSELGRTILWKHPPPWDPVVDHDSTADCVAKAKEAKACAISAWNPHDLKNLPFESGDHLKSGLLFGVELL